MSPIRTPARRLLSAGLAAVTVLSLAAPAAAAPARGTTNSTAQGNQQMVTLKQLIKEAARSGDPVTEASLQQTIATSKSLGQRSWEQGVEFTTTAGFSGAFGEFSVATLPDGTVGIALAGDGGCTMATISPDGTVDTFSYGDLGKNCSGEVALGGSAQKTPEWVDPVPPAAPGGVTVTSGDELLEVAWAAVDEADVTGYEIYVDGLRVGTVGADTTSTVVADLANGVEYTIVVVAVDEAANASEPSEPVSGIPADVVAPAAPTQLQVVPDDGTLTVTWLAPSDADVAGFDVLVGGQVVATVDAGTTTVVLDGLTNGVDYDVTVVAFDEVPNVSDPSEVVTAAPADLTAPDAPTGVTAEPASASAGTVTWTASVSDDVAAYQVLVGGQVTATVDASVTSVSLTDLPAGGTVTITVTAVDEVGNVSASSDPVSLQLPGQQAVVSGNYTAIGSHIRVFDTVTGADGSQYLLGGYNSYRGANFAGAMLPRGDSNHAAFVARIAPDGTVHLIAAIDAARNGGTVAGSYLALNDDSLYVSGYGLQGFEIGDFVVPDDGVTAVEGFLARFALDGNLLFFQQGGTDLRHGVLAARPDGGVFASARHGSASWLYGIDDAGVIRSATALPADMYAVEVRPDGGVIVAGSPYGNVSWGTRVLPAHGKASAFVGEILPDGTHGWAVVGGGPGPVINRASDVVLNDDGSVWVSGSYSSWYSWKPAEFGSHRLYKRGGIHDGFVALVRDGQWEKAVAVSGVLTQHAQTDLVAGPDGDVFVVGSLQNHSSNYVTQWVGSTPLRVAPSGYVAYTARLTQGGVWRWARLIGSNRPLLLGGDAGTTDTGHFRFWVNGAGVVAADGAAIFPDNSYSRPVLLVFDADGNLQR